MNSYDVHYEEKHKFFLNTIYILQRLTNPLWEKIQLTLQCLVNSDLTALQEIGHIAEGNMIPNV